jgi:hypothetical protein
LLAGLLVTNRSTLPIQHHPAFDRAQAVPESFQGVNQAGAE